MSKISPERAERAIRQRFNPITALKPQALAGILDRYHQGYLRDAALLWEAMERRDDKIRTVATKRKKSVARAQYEILATGKSERALLHKQVLEKFYDNVEVTDVLKRNQRGGVGLLRRQMMDAAGKGFAVHEIVWKPVQGEGSQRALGKKVRRAAQKAAAGESDGNDGFASDGGEIQFMTAQFIFCPLWFFENTTGTLRFLLNDYDATGVEMKEGEWLVTCGDAIMEACSVLYCYKHMSLKDWVIYSQGFGSPIPWGKTSAGRDSKEWTELETAVSSMMSEMSIVTSDSESIELIEAKAGGSNFPMPNLVEYCDRGTAVLWRGADLSTLSQGQAGIGASLQGDESDLLQEDDANDITETLWQIDKMVIRMVTGDEEPLAYIKILPPKKQAVDQDIKIDEFLSGKGCKLGQDDALERYGRSPAQDGDDILESAPAAGNPPTDNADSAAGKGGFENSASAIQAMQAAKRELLLPILEPRLRAIDAMTDRAQQEAAMIGLLAELPAIKAKLANEAATGEVVDVLVEQMMTALAEGFSKGLKGPQGRKDQKR